MTAIPLAAERPLRLALPASLDRLLLRLEALRRLGRYRVRRRTNATHAMRWLDSYVAHSTGR